MTTITTPLTTTTRTVTPTAADRALLALSRALARVVDTRMRSRTARLVDENARCAARERGRSLAAETEFTLRVR